MDNRIKRTLFYIEQNITDPVSLSKLADVACLSSHHFHRLFKGEMNETPKVYVDRVRMEHAAHMMIIRKDIGITELAFDYGYSSPAAFTRAFKAQFDTNPRAYRDHMRNEHRERLERHWASMADGENFAARALHVKHMPTKRLKAVRTYMQKQAVNKAYKQLIIQNSGCISHGITIYTEGPFREDRDKARLHIALDETIEPAPHEHVLELRSGYYYQQPVTGDFESMTDSIFEVFQRDIEPSRYKIASTTFYERVKLPIKAEGFDYFSCERIVFGCLVRK